VNYLQCNYLNDQERSGKKNTKKAKKARNAIKLSVSFNTKYGKKDILSEADEIPNGLFEPS
jgi:hypothetical protein